MKIKDIDAAIVEAERFIKAAKKARANGGATEYSIGSGETHRTIGRHAAAAKRASLDLTRALAELRNRS